MKVPTVFAAASLILVAASATACSAGSKAASATAPAPSSAGHGGSAATANAGTSSAGKKFDVCTALPATQASQITGTTFTKTKTSNVESLIFNCEYDGPSSALLQISVTTSGGKYGFDSAISALKAVSHPPTPVSGVGDEAFSEPNPQGNAGSVGASSFASYGALFGDTFIQIGGLTHVNASQGKQIVEELHSKL
jgi:hypothetical protein